MSNSALITQLRQKALDTLFAPAEKYYEFPRPFVSPSCQITLEKFKMRVEAAIDKNFVSTCSGDIKPQQVCAATRPAAPVKKGKK